MGVGKHLIKRMTIQSASVIYVHSFFNKKKVRSDESFLFFFFIEAQQG